MARKNKKDKNMVNAPVGNLSYTFRILNNSGPVPVARPSDFIQLTPSVQPVPIMPYTDHGGADDGYDDYYDGY